jgi:hypothetical protein
VHYRALLAAGQSYRVADWPFATDSSELTSNEIKQYKDKYITEKGNMKVEVSCPWA